MIGNDVVDLGDPEVQPGASHRRFDRRVFSAAERGRLASAGAPDRERWVLWAAKEAAYKLARARDGGLPFSPVRFEVTRTGPARARVRWRGPALAVELRLAGEAVHAIARCSVGAGVASAVGRDRLGDPSQSVRALAVEVLAPRLGVPPGDLGVERAPGEPPVLLLRGRPTTGTLSLSHHGRFVAFAYELPGGTGGT